MFRSVCCKHVHAVEISRRLREAVAETVTIKAVDLGRCKRCDSENIVKDRARKLKRGTVQGFKCRDCGKKFTHNLGFERKRATPEQISTAVDWCSAGCPRARRQRSSRE